MSQIIAQEQVRTFTQKPIEPEAKGQSNQKVYETKKTIFRFDQVVWYILGVMEVLLAFRVVLKALGADQYSGFASLIYSVTDPPIAPFRGIFGIFVSGNSVFDWTTVVAGIVYLCLAWGLVYLLDLIYPITPNDVNT